jgi:hypothetical protein
VAQNEFQPHFTLRPTSAQSAERVGAALRSLTSRLVIVIEDWHLVYDSTWILPFFERLFAPEKHILITSRSMPPAPLWRMRSKQTLLVVYNDSLLRVRRRTNFLRFMAFQATMHGWHSTRRMVGRTTVDS